MAIRYYDDIVAEKLKRWLPETSNLRILKPDETKRLFELTADDTNDRPLKLPFIALSRDNSIELLSNIKQARSFDGLKIASSLEQSLLFNIIPIKVEYQLDIYTKTFEEGDEYLRNFLFKLINNPQLVVTIPYNGTNIQHTANMRVLTTITDNSAINERLFNGQFTRWTIQIELQDAFLFNIPYKQNWYLDGEEILIDDEQAAFYKIETFNLEIADKIKNPIESEREEIIGLIKKDELKID